MSQIVTGRVKEYLRDRLNYRPNECAAIIEQMRALARAGGHELTTEFAGAGLAAGPEARVASAIVDRALQGGGTDSSEYAIRKNVAQWLRRSGPKTKSY